MTAPRPLVIHVITRLELGGAQQNTLDTCRRLDRGRFRVALLAGPDGRLEPDAARIPDLDFRIIPDLVREVSPLRDRRARRELTEHFRELAGADRDVIVHTHSSKAGILGREAARRAGVRHVVHTVHGFGHPAFANPLLRQVALALERRAARGTSAFVCVSNANLEEGRRLRLFGDRPVHLVRSSIELAAFRAPGVSRDEARAALGLTGGAPVVGTVACLKPQKAPLDWLAVAARVRERLPHARFVIAGDGELRPAVEERARALGLHRSLHLLGWRDDVPRILRALDVFLLTSRWEGLPRALVQAMACGVPAVATAVDGVRDVLEEGVTGFSAPPGDVATLARRVIELLEEPERGARMVEAARDRTSEFDLPEMIARLEGIYDGLLRG